MSLLKYVYDIFRNTTHFTINTTVQKSEYNPETYSPHLNVFCYLFSTKLRKPRAKFRD